MSRPTLPAPDAAWLDSLSRDALEAAATERTEAAWRLAREVFPALPRPALWFDLRGQSAGQAHFGRGGLRLNRVLLEENRQAFFVEIIPHEMAHWLVRHLEEGRRVRPHGHEWRTVMRRLYGLAPRVTHGFDTRRASPAPYRYTCDCREHHLGARRHARIVAGQRYYCRHCRQWLRPVSDESA